MDKTLGEMGNQVYTWADSKGWHNPEPTFGECIALLHSECSEALDAYRDNGLADATTVTDYDCCALAGPGECEGGHPLDKPEGVGSEFADVLIRLLHYSKLFSVDLDAEYDRKMAYNETRAYRHGGRSL